MQKIKQQYGDPIALVHDMGSGILSAVKTVFKDIPDFICHFHFLRDIGKDLFEKEYAQIRNRLQKHKIRSLLRRKIKALEKIVGNDTEAEGQLMAGIDQGHISIQRLSTKCPLWQPMLLYIGFLTPQPRWKAMGFLLTARICYFIKG